MGLNNYDCQGQKGTQELVAYLRLQVGSKKFIQSCPEASRREGHSQFPARSVLPVREYRKWARTLLGAFFNRPWIVFTRWPRMGRVHVTHRQPRPHNEGKGF